jgi:hypothetical protein
MSFRSGQWVIVAMFGGALAAAVFGMWYRYQSTRRALEFWGPPAAVLIARAPTIEALIFEPPLTDNGAITLDVLDEAAAKTTLVSGARGMLNIRQAMVEDSTFRWDPPVSQPPAWSFALMFSDGDRQAALLFDPAAGAVGNPATGARVLLDPTASQELSEFFHEQFPAPKP